MKDDVIENLHDEGKVKFLLNAWHDKHMLDFGERVKSLDANYNELNRQVMEELVTNIDLVLEDVKGLLEPVLAGKYEEEFSPSRRQKIFIEQAAGFKAEALIQKQKIMIKQQEDRIKKLEEYIV